MKSKVTSTALMLVVLGLAALMAGCKAETHARDTAAALYGAISQAQVQYRDGCVANPKDQACAVINQAIDAQNALITAAEAYCGWGPQDTTDPARLPQTCAAVKDYEGVLNAGVANAVPFIAEVKALVKGGK